MEGKRAKDKIIKYVLRIKDHPSSAFLHTAGWNIDVIPGAQVAMLGCEAEVYVGVVEQERKHPDS